MRPDRLGSDRWTRAVIAAALFAIACIPFASAGHGHLFSEGDLRIETADVSPSLSLCELCRLAHERALPSAEGSSGRSIARTGSTQPLALSVPPPVDLPQQPCRAPPSAI